ncbi:MAG: hypothetical protein F9K16_06190 [Thermoanaerobaculia bacterium]|nr:MAG: hypothetical protein F9K16_06190 [Thermoanaerobaculia bacterium]MBZ0102296.1 hypothetical protein [Thermoanaerobaculia bacterium]
MTPALLEVDPELGTITASPGCVQRGSSGPVGTAGHAGPVAVAMQAVVLVVGIALALLGRRGIARGWLT